MRRWLALALAGIAACSSDTFVQADGGAGDDGGGGNDGAVGNDAPAFNVKNLSGLVLWLKGDAGIGANPVAQWNDQSGNNNNATETRPELEPTLVTDGINHLPSVHFAARPQQATGNDLLFAATASLGWGTGDFLVEVVARYDNDPTNPATVEAVGYGDLYVTIFGGPITNATAGIGLYANVPPLGANPASTGFLGFYAGKPGVGVPSSGTGYNDGTPHCFGLQRVGATLSVRLDGVAVGSKPITGGGDLGATSAAHLGAVENATAQRLDGDIAEVIAVKGVIAPSDLASLESYLVAKYKLP